MSAGSSAAIGCCVEAVAMKGLGVLVEMFFGYGCCGCRLIGIGRCAE